MLTEEASYVAYTLQNLTDDSLTVGCVTFRGIWIVTLTQTTTDEMLPHWKNAFMHKMEEM